MLLFTTLAVAEEPIKLESAFNITDVTFVKQPGTSDCAGFNIELLPAAAYSKERITKTYGNDQQGQILIEQNPPKFTPDVPEYHDMLIKGACDQRGTFSFSNVPAGSYFVIAFIIWDDTSGATPRKTGGGVMRRIDVPSASRVEVVLGQPG